MRTGLSGLLAIISFANVNAAVPAISKATLSNGSLKIGGSNFGGKAVAAPHKFQPFIGTTQGQTYSQAGFDFVAGNNSAAARNYVDMTDGMGGGSWLHITPGGGAESFSHFGHLLPEKSNAVYASYWVRMRRLTPATGGRTGQFKAMRSGIRTGSDPIANMYYVNPKYEFSCFVDVMNFSALTGPNAGSRNAAGAIQEFYPERAYDVPLINDSWIFCEVYYRLNTVGQADGIQQIRFNGTQNVDVRDRQPRTAASEFLGYMQYSPGLSNDFAQSSWEVRFSRIYLDTTRARVFLGNAATLAACKGRFLLAPTSWNDTAVSVGAATNIPAGYNWAYVSNHNGEINATGYNIAATTGMQRGLRKCNTCKSEGKSLNEYNASGRLMAKSGGRPGFASPVFPEAGWSGF